eukprot:TRINITY_DN9805_c0_g1_i3.p1 TRINITY_DN9805_c0_g1~~TRINITY_DN9805_c0_g1_i3.p1  ORF type:complete len:269 (+),score=11.18 TRINITY_DN9805_c0_g1_i3:434-1240(+)
MAFTSPAYTPTSQPYHHEPMYNDEALASMSPELLGSARLPPMTPEQRQEYVDGITIKAKYVGTIEVPEPKGEQMILTAISRVRAHHKAQKEHKQRVWLSISTSGLKILHFDNFSLQDSYALSQISYTTILPSNKRVFAFISANTSVQPPIFKCHVFKSNSKASIITLTLGRCFSIALEDARSQGGQLVVEDPIRRSIWRVLFCMLHHACSVTHLTMGIHFAVLCSSIQSSRRPSPTCFPSPIAQLGGVSSAVKRWPSFTASRLWLQQW